MERREREVIVSPTEETVPLEEKRAIPPPRFDEKSIQRARPAVPLALGKRVRSSSLPVVLLCVLGGMAGGLLGGLALTFYQRGGSGVAVESAHTRTDAGGSGATTQAGPDGHAAPQQTAAAPAPIDTHAGAVAMNTSGQGAQTPAADGSAAQAPAPDAAPDSAARAAAGDASEAQPDASTQGELRSALGEWLAATNARDVGRQMNFYAPTVDAFYLSRNASRAAVREEKSRAFAAAQSVNVEAAQPDIRLSRDGRTAVMRFRKRYQITAGDGSRRGEVLQELRWRRTGNGWKIVSERDLRVLQ